MTQVQPDWAQFRRHVVRIDGRGRTLLGTGFFVAPRLALTAAHVVYDARRREPLEQVEVVPADPGVGTGAVRARVIARSAPASGTLLPPFPDLAVLELPPELSWVDSHPCVWLSDGLPVGEWCYAYGFAPREPGVVPGAPASLRFEGPDGDGFLRFKSVQVAGGLSGAPLVCPGQRAVVGVVTASRDVSSDLGGWASPIAALFGGAAELAEAGARIRAANRPAVLADRGAWHAVLPLRPAADPVKRDNHFVREPRSLPSEMLLADANTVAYRFRERQLDRARRWCERPEPLAISLVWGPAGAGKTRLAIELCRLMRSRHWLAQLWVPPSPGGRARPDISRLPLPRLLVVDYAESVAPASLLRLLENLHIRATELIPARVVLLTRDAGEGDKLLREIAGQAEVDLRNVINATGAAVTIPGLTPDERGILFTEAYQSFRSAWREDPAGGPVREPDLSGDRYAVVLEVLLEAFDHALSGGRPTGDRPPVDRSLDHEQRYWTATAPKKLSAELRRAAVALATMAGGADAEEGVALLATVPDLAGPRQATLRRHAVAWLTRLYGRSGRLGPLRPDRLGEALVASVLSGQEDPAALLRKVFALRDAQVARSLDLLARLAPVDAQTRAAVARALAGCHRELAAKAELAARGRPGQPGRPRLALGLQRLLNGPLRQQVEALVAHAGDAERAQFALSASYRTIADVVHDAGQGERAAALYAACVDIRSRLHWDDPANQEYARELSVAYNRWGGVLADLGDHDQARDLYDKALDIRRRLVATRPGDPDRARLLAVSYEKLGDLAARYADRPEAARLQDQAYQIRERLAADYPADATYARDLSISCERLGDLAMEAGDYTAARGHYQRCLDIRERLVRDPPTDTTPARDLSNLYDRLGDIATDEEDYPAAAQHFRRALELRQGLCEREPDNTRFRRDLCVSYAALGYLAQRENRWGDAESFYLNGLAGTRRLLDLEPRNTNFARDLCRFFELLGDLADDRDEQDQARQWFTQGLRAVERLRAVDPDNRVLAQQADRLRERLSSA